MGAEHKVQVALAKEFGQPFAARTLQVGLKLNREPAYKEFDAVSLDGKVVAMVKDYSAQNLQGNQTRHARVMRDLYYLSLVKAEKRFMYLSAEFYEWFATQQDASIPYGLEVRIIPSQSNAYG